MAKSEYSEYQPVGANLQPYDLVQAQFQIREAMANIDRDAYTSLRDDRGAMKEFTLTASVEEGIPHNLGKEVTAWRVVWQDAAATFYVDPASSLDLTKFLPLTASANVTIRLEVRA